MTGTCRRGFGGDTATSTGHTIAATSVAELGLGVLIATGVWNILAVHGQSSAYKTTLNVKMTLVLLSGVCAYLHTRATSKKSMAIWGALSGLTAVATLFVGIMLGNAPATP